MSFVVAQRRFLVIGAARTGQSVARFLHRRGGTVRLVERSASRLEGMTVPAGIEIQVGDEADSALRDVDVVVPSPGVAATHPLLQGAVRRGLPVLSEIELAARFLTCPILAITGTNGKSTTTVLLGAMLREAGSSVFVGGNLGTPLIEACADDHTYAACVVEVRIALVLTNV